MVLTRVSKTISSLSTGIVTDYALYILIGGCFYLFIFTVIPSFEDLAYSITISSISILILIRSINSNSGVNKEESNLYIESTRKFTI
jgi:hypothetical protein